MTTSTDGFCVDTDLLAGYQTHIAAEEQPVQTASSTVTTVYHQVNGDPGAFDTKNHWALVNNALSQTQTALASVSKAVGEIAKGLGALHDGYGKGEGQIQGAYQKALTKLPDPGSGHG